MTEDIIHLPDGRLLSYALYGPADGWPVLYFHGTPSSRLEPRLLEAFDIDLETVLHQRNLQLIAIDRPGMGLSSYRPNAGLLSFATDSASLINHLKIAQASVLCWSGGGPYALAMAWQYPALIKNVFILCGFTQPFQPEVIRQMKLNKWYFNTARHTPWLLRSAMNSLRKIVPKHSLPRWLTGLPLPDYALIKHPAQLQSLARLTFQEACRQDAKGPVEEARMYFDEFKFSLSDIIQPVHYWWGTEDNSVVRLHAEALERALKNSVLHYKKGEGHLSLYVHYFEEVLETIAALSGPF